MSMIRNSEIISASGWLPDKIVKTKNRLEQASIDGLGSSFLDDVLGIHEVREAGKIPCAEMAACAAEKLLAKTKINRNKIDAVIYCGITRDFVEPATAFCVQNLLGIKAKICFDISNACAGIASGITAANGFIRGEIAEYVLLVSAENNREVIFHLNEYFSTKRDKKQALNRLGGYSLGDGAGAMLLGPTRSNAGIKKMNSVTDGRFYDLCYYDTHSQLANGQMKMKEIGARTLALARKLTNATFGHLEDRFKDVDLLLTHQVGALNHKKVIEISGLEEKQVIKTFPHLGNLASVTIPINYEIAEESGQINCADNYLIFSSGSGISVSQFLIAR